MISNQIFHSGHFVCTRMNQSILQWKALQQNQQQYWRRWVNNSQGPSGSKKRGLVDKIDDRYAQSFVEKEGFTSY